MASVDHNEARCARLKEVVCVRLLAGRSVAKRRCWRTGSSVARIVTVRGGHEPRARMAWSPRRHRPGGAGTPGPPGRGRAVRGPAPPGRRTRGGRRPSRPARRGDVPSHSRPPGPAGTHRVGVHDHPRRPVRRPPHPDRRRADSGRLTVTAGSCPEYFFAAPGRCGGGDRPTAT